MVLAEAKPIYRDVAAKPAGATVKLHQRPCRHEKAEPAQNGALPVVCVLKKIELSIAS
jgi:hypothetical protein